MRSTGAALSIICLEMVIIFTLARLAIAKPSVIRLNIGASTEEHLLGWGQAVAQRSMRDFSRGPGKVLAARIRCGHKHNIVTTDSAATAWDQGIWILMLAAGAEHQPVDARLLRRYVPQLKSYWRIAKGLGGYNANPGVRPLDRYYDDNEWITWGLLRAYRTTEDISYLRMAEADFKFITTGYSHRLGGGVFWHEQNKNYKNTCANAPAVIDAMQLFRITHRQHYLRFAMSIYHWVNTHLQAPDHLYYDGEHLNHTINKMKWSYNSGAMLRANCLIYRVKHRRLYLRRAQAIATAARKRWISTTTGGVRDGGPFAWVLLDGFLHLYRIDHQTCWLRTAIDAMSYVHHYCRDRNGFYGRPWNRPVIAGRPRNLLDQAAAGDAFFEVANTIHFYLRSHK